MKWMNDMKNLKIKLLNNNRQAVAGGVRDAGIFYLTIWEAMRKTTNSEIRRNLILNSVDGIR